MSAPQIYNHKIRDWKQISPTTTTTATIGVTVKKRQGFAAMSAEKQREIASKGGKAAHARGKAHEWTPAEARIAGRLGAQARIRNRQLLEAELEGTPV
jgi:general stress protein YciG